MEYKDNISFQNERDLFIRYANVTLFHNSANLVDSVVSSSILVLLKCLETTVDVPFDKMAKTQWASIENVSGPSSYVSELTKAVDQVVDAVNPLIEQKKYLRNFYDKAAA